MKTASRVILATLLFAAYSFMASPVSAEVFYGTVKASKLNIRESPTTSSNIIKKLDIGDRVIVSPLNHDWLMILVDGKLGYVSASFVDVDTTLPLGIPDNEECTTDILNTSISTSAVDFYCDESIVSGGFKSCTVELSVSAESTCSQDAEAYVSCNATFNYRTQNGYLSQMDTSFTTGSFWLDGGTGYRTMYIEWSPFTVIDIVTKVGVDSVECTLTDVFQ